MINKFYKMVRSSPIRVIPLVVLIIFITAASNIYSYKLEAESLRNFKKTLQKQSEQETWKQISTMIELANIAARQNSKFIAKKLEADILHQYPNMNELKKEFDKDKYGKKFHEILKNNLIVQNSAPSALHPHPFYTIVGLEKGILEIFSSGDSGITSTSSQLVDWNSFINANANPPLTQKAIDAVLAKDDGLIFWQTTMHSDQEAIGNMDLHSLQKIYETKGLEGFKNISIVSPSYITDNGDIFNTDDKTYMSPNKNYKLIILQSFNLYDILIDHRSELLETQNIAIQNMTVIDGLLETEFLRTILWSTILFILCLSFVSIYNAHVYSCQEHCKKVKRDALI